MTQETPAKIFSLLGAAMFSMFFLFAVTVSNASFTRVEKPLPDPFSSDNVMAVIDSVASSYSKFIDANLVQPEIQSLAIAKDNLDYIIDEASPAILAYTGLSSLADVYSSGLPQVAHSATLRATSSGVEMVAGASTEAVDSEYYPSSAGVFGIFFQ